MTNAPVAMITGAAKRLGAVTAKTLHQHGCNIIIHCNQSTAAAAQLCDTFNQQRKNSAIFFSAPLGDIQHVQQQAQQAIQHWGRLDYLVNNASSFYPKSVADTTEQDWQNLLNSNVTGAFFLSQTAAPMLTKSQGAIVNIVDIYAQRPLAEHTAYCVAKAGLAMLTQSLAKELAPKVRVNGVAPGAILWPEHNGEQLMNDTDKQTLLDKVPLQRAGAAEDIAGAVKFLLMDAPYITGQILAVDGGRSLII